MKMPTFIISVPIALALVSTVHAQDPIPIAAIERTEAVDFGKEIFPLLKKNCIACHNGSKAKGQLNLEDPEVILKGGSEGPAIVPGKPEESFLLQVAAHQEDPIMPPEKNKANAVPFTSEELGLLSLWIAEGAKGKAPLATATPTQWVATSKLDHPVYHMALGPEDQFIAASRGPRVHLYDLRRRASAGQLIDPTLAKQDLYRDNPTTHQDFVQSIAFSSEGWIATGGFRNVKLWKPNTGNEVHLHALPDKITDMATSSDGKWSALGDVAGNVLIVDASTKRGAHKRHEGKVLSLAFSPDNQFLATSGADKKIHLLSIADEKVIRRR